MKLNGKQAREMARDIILRSAEPVGPTALKDAILKKHPQTADGTVRGAVWKMHVDYPGEIVKTADGFKAKRKRAAAPTFADAFPATDPGVQRDAKRAAEIMAKAPKWSEQPKAMAKHRQTADAFAPSADRPDACPRCDSGDVTAALRLPSGTWKCQTCGAVWRRHAPHGIGSTIAALVSPDLGIGAVTAGVAASSHRIAVGLAKPPPGVEVVSDGGGRTIRTKRTTADAPTGIVMSEDDAEKLRVSVARANADLARKRTAAVADTSLPTCRRILSLLSDRTPRTRVEIGDALGYPRTSDGRAQLTNALSSLRTRQKIREAGTAQKFGAMGPGVVATWTVAK